MNGRRSRQARKVCKLLRLKNPEGAHSYKKWKKIIKQAYKNIT